MSGSPYDLKEDPPSIETNGDKKLQVEDEYPHGLRLAFIVLAIGLSIFLASLDMTIVATAIPRVTDEFHGLDKVSWYGAAFFLTNGAFTPSWGKAYKYFPLKSTFLLAIFIFEVGSLVCGAAPNPVALIVGRAIAGIGASGIGTGAFTIIAFVAEPQKRATFTGIIGISYGVASVLGPLVGGVFADKVSWRWCFYINLPLGGLSAAIILFFFHAPHSAKPVPASRKEKLLQMDFIGVILVMGAIVSYMLALQHGGLSKAWNSSEVIGLIVAFAAISLVFSGWEYFLRERAMLPPRLLKQRTIAISCIAVFLFSGSYFVIMYEVPIYFQSILGANPTMSGVDNLPLIFSFSLSMVISGIMISSTGRAVPIQVAAQVIACLVSGLFYTFDLNTSPGKWIGYQILGGVGWGFAFQVPIIIAPSGANPEDISTIISMIAFFQCIGGTILLSAAQSAFGNKLISTLQTSAPEINPALVIATGATELRAVFSADQVVHILAAYMAGIKAVFAISIAATGLAVVVSSCNSWKRLVHDGKGADKGVGLTV
ncbi:major facilitator superfamily domain-containing protein [Flagelloscypha sp. PMI_526]|nr:major facilitator superfamily domain-containing protein [Flagelloscypha sp. PMI_526]